MHPLSHAVLPDAIEVQVVRSVCQRRRVDDNLAGASVPLRKAQHRFLRDSAAVRRHHPTFCYLTHLPAATALKIHGTPMREAPYSSNGVTSLKQIVPAAFNTGAVPTRDVSFRRPPINDPSEPAPMAQRKHEPLLIYRTSNYFMGTW
jgi:hypothetical protein